MRLRKGVEESGQSTVEYVVVCAAVMVAVVSMGALWRFGSAGGYQKVAQNHASHVLEAEGGVIDVLLY